MYFKAHILLALITYDIFFACATAAVCNDKQVIESKPLTMPSGVVITMETFNCSDSVIANDPSHHPSRRDSVHSDRKRAASQCTTSSCVCGVPCFFQGCGPVSEPISGGDCTELANELMSNPATFTITPPIGVAFILETCTYSFLGPSVPTEYCFDDMGAAALELFHVCGATQQGSCGGSSGPTEFFINQISL